MAPSWKATPSGASAAAGRPWKSDGSGYLAHEFRQQGLAQPFLAAPQGPPQKVGSTDRPAAQSLAWVQHTASALVCANKRLCAGKTLPGWPAPQVPGSGPPRTLSSWVRASYI